MTTARHAGHPFLPDRPKTRPDEHHPPKFGRAFLHRFCYRMLLRFSKPVILCGLSSTCGGDPVLVSFCRRTGSRIQGTGGMQGRDTGGGFVRNGSRIQCSTFLSVRYRIFHTRYVPPTITKHTNHDQEEKPARCNVK